MTQTSRETEPRSGEGESGWRSDVERAAKDFVVALSKTPEFEAFEHAYLRFRDDERAQEALRAFQARQQELQAMLMLGAATADQRAELERLREAWMAEPSVTEYVQAQASLSMLSRAIDEAVSEKMGLGFAAACQPTCCG